MSIASSIAPSAPALPAFEACPRLLSRAQVRELVPYSDMHRDRLSKAGKFPEKLKLGGSRVGYLESEVMAWIADKAAARTGGAA